jgi:hypothetical protein
MTPEQLAIIVFLDLLVILFLCDVIFDLHPIEED